MKISKNNIKVLATVMVLLTTAAAIAGIPALIRHEEHASAPVAVAEAMTATLSKEDQAILGEMYTVSHQLDSMTVYTIEGTINVKDLADSTNSMTSSYMYTRSGDQAYYRLGQSEMVSLKELYLAISHDTKDIFLFAPKQVTSPVSVPVEMQVNSLKKEGYKVTRTSSEGVVTISLNNSTHATLREYSLTYDSTGWMRATNMRVADELHPGDRSRDKLIAIQVRKFEPGKAREELLKSGRYLQQKKGVVIPVAAMKDYEMIKDR